MNRDPNANVPTPAEEDPVVHRFLGTLPRFELGTQFETRVLRRVWRPVPPRLRERWRRFAGSWEARLFLGLLAAGAFLWQAGMVTLAMQFPAEAREIGATAVRQGLPFLWEQTGNLLGQLLGLAKTWIGAWIAGKVLWLVGALAVILVSVIGLIWVARSGRMKHAWQ